MASLISFSDQGIHNQHSLIMQSLSIFLIQHKTIATPLFFFLSHEKTKKGELLHPASPSSEPAESLLHPSLRLKQRKGELLAANARKSPSCCHLRMVFTQEATVTHPFNSSNDKKRLSSLSVLLLREVTPRALLTQSNLSLCKLARQARETPPERPLCRNRRSLQRLRMRNAAQILHASASNAKGSVSPTLHSGSPSLALWVTWLASLLCPPLDANVQPLSLCHATLLFSCRHLHAVRHHINGKPRQLPSPSCKQLQGNTDHSLIPPPPLHDLHGIPCVHTQPKLQSCHTLFQI